MKRIQFIIDENEYLVQIGNNQNENAMLLNQMQPEDSWFHLSEVSSPHLIINANVFKFSKKDIYRIAILLKQNTKYRKENHISICYTLRKNLKLTSKPGEVIITDKINIIKV